MPSIPFPPSLFSHRVVMVVVVVVVVGGGTADAEIKIATIENLELSKSHGQVRI